MPSEITEPDITLANKDPEACGLCQRKTQPWPASISSRLMFEVGLKGRHVQICRDCLRRMHGKPALEHPDWEINFDRHFRYARVKGKHASGLGVILNPETWRARKYNKQSLPERDIEKWSTQFKAIAAEWLEHWKLEADARGAALINDYHRRIEREMEHERQHA